MHGALKDKALSQNTVHKVHNRIRRLQRDVEAGVSVSRGLGAQLKAALAEVDDQKRMLWTARDAENELVLRYIEAKLQNELLSDAAAVLDNDIVQLQRDIAAVSGDLTVKECNAFRLRGAEQQRRNEVDAAQTFISQCHAKAALAETSCTSTLKTLSQTKRQYESESKSLATMCDRLKSVKENVERAVALSCAGELRSAN